MEINKKIIVLAGSRQQFEHYLRENNLTEKDAVYGRSLDSIRGINASRVVETGTCWENKDYYELRREAINRIR